MAIKFEISKFPTCFPTKILGGNGGEHILNMVLNEDCPNGVVYGVGDYVSFDQYKTATAPLAYEAVITEKAANGNWYVQVKKVDVNDPAVLIYEVPESTMGNYDARFTALDTFYNKKGDVVRGYVLHVLDIYELSEDAFEGTPAPGKKVTILGKKHVVATTVSQD